MRRIVWIVAFVAGLAPAAKAQEHGQAAVYGDFFRLNQTKTNFAGLGARLSVNSHRWLQWEAEMNYDFEQVFTEGFANNTTSPPTITSLRSNIRVLHGLFGPKIQSGHGAIRPFLTLKGGFVNFRFDPKPATVATFVSSVDSLRSKDVSGVLYPGGGLEAHLLGPIGLRLDLGDEIYFNSGTHHNVHVAIGPMLRF